MTELRKKVLNEINSLHESCKDNENLRNNLTLLFNYIKDEKRLKDDQDIRIFLYTNRDHEAIKPYSNRNDENYDAINQIITGKEPNLIKEDIDLKKVLGETYADPKVFEDMKGKHIKNLTDAEKVNFYNVLKAKEDEDVKKAREEAFYGTNWLQQLFIPRTYERRMRGEATDDLLEGAGKDLALDIAENAAYTFLPAKPLKFLPKFEKPILKALGTVADFGARAAVDPFAMEGLDAAAYGDNANTDRKDFSWTDALLGSSVNAVAPMVIKGPISPIAGLISGSKNAPKVSKFVSEFGEGQSISDLSREAKDIGTKKVASIRSQSGLNTQQNKITKAAEQVKEAEALLEQAKKQIPPNNLEIQKAEGNLDFYKKELNDVTKTTSDFIPALQAYDDKMKYKEYDPRLLKHNSKIEKMDETFKNMTNEPKFIDNFNIGTFDQKAKLVDEVLKTTDLNVVDKYYVRNELLDILKDVKFDSVRDAEEYLLNYLKNKLGDLSFEGRESSLPIVGNFLKGFKDDELIEKRNEARKENASRFLLPEFKSYTTKESK